LTWKEKIGERKWKKEIYKENIQRDEGLKFLGIGIDLSCQKKDFLSMDLEDFNEANIFLLKF